MTAAQHNASPNGRFTPNGVTRARKDFPVEEPGPTRAGHQSSVESHGAAPAWQSPPTSQVAPAGGTVGSLESWGRAVQDVEGHRLLGLEERRKRELEEQLVAYARGERFGVWKENPVVAKRVPQRIATLEEMRAEIIERRRLAVMAEKRKERNAD